MRARQDQALGRVAKDLAGVPTAEELETAARELVAIRYYRRFLDEVAVHDDAVAARGEGAVHG
jgi:hypothetical protein